MLNYVEPLDISLNYFENHHDSSQTQNKTKEVALWKEKVKQMLSTSFKALNVEKKTIVFY